MPMSYLWLGITSDHLGHFLVFSDYNEVSTGEKLLKTKESFWVINIIDEILPMVSDGLDIGVVPGR